MMIAGLDKRRLRKIPVQVVSLTERDFTQGVAIRFNAYMVDATLVLDFYKDNNKERPAIRVFLESDKWKSMIYEGEGFKWSEGSLDYLLGFYRYYQPGYYTTCRGLGDSESLVNKKLYLPKDETAFYQLCRYQQKVMDDRLKSKHQKIKDRIDEAVANAPDAPDGFRAWVFDEVFKDQRFIFYTFTGNKLQRGFCTHCKSQVNVKGAKHMTHGICPNCQSQVEFRADKKSAMILCERTVSILSKNVNSDGFNVRTVEAVRRIDKCNWSLVKDSLSESSLNFYKSDFRLKDVYRMDFFKNTGELRWCYGDTWAGQPLMNLYPHNIKGLLPDSHKYCALDIMAEKSPIGTSFSSFMANYLEYPEMEYFIKYGMYKLATALPDVDRNISLNRQTRKISEYFGVDDHAAKLIKDSNICSYGLYWLKSLCQENINSRKIESIDELKEIEDMYYFSANLNVPLKYMSYRRLRRYLSVQERDYRKAAKLSEYRDYLSMCEQLSYDLTNDFILFPKDLTNAHNDMAKQIKAATDKAVRNALLVLHEEYTKAYGFSFDEFIISAPKSAEDLAAEGQALFHCVGSYAQRIAERKTIVLFIRKADAPDTPYATVEIDKGEIRQCRGKNNKDLTNELKKLLTQFKKEKLEIRYEKVA